jgi:tryptophan synthase alpha subunit
MKRMSSKEKAEFRKSMADIGYSRIPIYAPTSAKELRAEIIEVTDKMIADYEERNNNG